MSKRPKRSRHRIPAIAFAPKDSEHVDERYQAEVDAAMSRLERMYRNAQKALEAAERRAERTRTHADNLARKQVEAARVAEQRAAEESRLSGYLMRIRDAARHTAGESGTEREYADTVAKRNAVTALRKAEARDDRERDRTLSQLCAESAELVELVEERRRELREIELLMMPASYAGREHRAFSARHTAGEPRV